MKYLHFDYIMQIDYAEEVSTCSFTIKCIPENNLRQIVEDIKIEVYPDTRFSFGRDGLNNVQIYGLNDIPHKTFRFEISGKARSGLSDYEEEADENLAMIFRHPHGLNVAGTKIREYYDSLYQNGALKDSRQKYIGGKDGSLDKESNYEQALSIMHCLHRDFRYQANVTTVDTTAEEAFGLGCGVCQDYAHIFIALLHLANIPARYVTGLIVGEGASHAWVEILEGNRWIGLDPTNDVKVRDEHIKIGIGRDAGDCMINRGIMHGGGLHTQTIKVNVSEME